MKIVLIEDHEDYRVTFKGLLRRGKIPGYNEKRDLVEGGLYPDAVQLLQLFEPEKGEKTLFIVDGTLNYREDEETTALGNAFNLVSGWIEERIDWYESTLSNEKLQSFKANVGIILHPSSWRYFDTEFFQPYKRIKAVCEKNGISILDHDKGEDTEVILKDIRSFFQSPEGKGPGWKK